MWFLNFQQLRSASKKILYDSMQKYLLENKF